ncbi:synergin gamma isoform X2 [Polypterus senegalus]|uniref:synergin gamma isoform X2 n=1 Tax=Polypterus senegalus TaxID=55291 RepID=UPI0019664D4B|nr:synergin gamma isoform X2 [Polypterus senegalus]
MALRPGAGGSGSFMFPVGGGLGPPQGMMPMQQPQQQQQQSFPVMQVIQPNMQGIIGMNFGSQMPPGGLPLQGGMQVGTIQATGMQFMGQPPFMGIRTPGSAYPQQLAEEHQKRLEQQQRILEEDRKRRQFEEQKQKLRLLSSVKPKMGEKSRDDALEAIKGNLDGFSRDAKMHPTPASHPKKPDASSSHPSVSSLPQPPNFPGDDDEFSDFMQGPAEPISSVSASHSTFQFFQASSLSVQTGPVQCPPALPMAPLRPVVPSQPAAPSVPIGLAAQHPSVTSSSRSSPIKGPSLEQKVVSSTDFTTKQVQDKLNSNQTVSELSHRAPAYASFQASGTVKNLGSTFRDEAAVPDVTLKTDSLASETGVGVYTQPEPIQTLMPAWLYNDSLVPDLYKKVLDLTSTTSGIDTAKLYPILMSSGLPREALGQIWATANRTTPGKLTKEELYTVLSMIGIAQRGLPAVSLDILSQFPTPPVPNLPAIAMSMPAVMSAQSIMSVPSVPPPAASVALATAQSTLGIPLQAPSVVLTSQAAFVPSFTPSSISSKTDDDDFQDFQEAPKAGSNDDSFSDFKGESLRSFSNPASSQLQNSVPAMLTPISGMSVSSSDKYAAFKQLSTDKLVEAVSLASDCGDKYSVFRELEQPLETKSVAEGFADFKSSSTDDGFTDFKTADSISPLEPSESAKTFPKNFPSPFLHNQPIQQQLPPSKTIPQPKQPLNMTDLDLFYGLGSSSSMSQSSSAVATTVTASSVGKVSVTEAKPITLPAPSVPTLMAGTSNKKIHSGVDDFDDFTLFGTSSVVAASSSEDAQDDFADFMAFGGAPSSGGLDEKSLEEKSKVSTSSIALGEVPQQWQQQQSEQLSNKYDVFKQFSLEAPSSLSFDDPKDGGVTISGVSLLKGDIDDFADFQSTSKLSATLSVSDRSLVDKVASFKQTKEDSASVKSLDLPSIGGSSVGKEDSEDALSVQLDMKLSDVGGDLKHVMSDSSLDLPAVSGHQPPAAEPDDLKFDPFGTFNGYPGATAVSSLASYDWCEQEEHLTSKDVKMHQNVESEGDGEPTSLALNKKETSFGSSENIAHTMAAIVTTVPTDEAASTGAKPGELPDAGPPEASSEADEFGDFASTHSVTSNLSSGLTEKPRNGSRHSSGDMDDFGAFQGEKPKFGKFDFLMASSQTKVKSSEEMIQSELATFDLSVQGSHKRSLSLGDKEINRSASNTAPEQQFRDRSNTLSEKPALPIIRDKYKDLTGEVEESERYAFEWQRCLESALKVIDKANDTLNGISSSSVCTEVIQSAQGMEYLQGVVEVYRVSKRVELGIKATAVCSEKLQQLLKDINRVWNNLMGFMSIANVSPDENSLDFSSCILRHGIKNAKELACGVCLLNVDSRSKMQEKSKPQKTKKAFNSETDNFKLLYGGHQYHASCANFWINCVEPKPPGLILPDLL